MAIRKPTTNDANYIDGKLSILKDQIDKAEQYLRSNSWTKVPDEKKEAEFRFQKGLTDSLMGWTESYMEMCGIMEIYKQLEAKKNRSNLKAGQSVSGIQKFVKNESLNK